MDGPDRWHRPLPQARPLYWTHQMVARLAYAAPGQVSHESHRQLAGGLRLFARGAGAIPGRVPRLVVPLAARNQRRARCPDGDAERGADAVLRRDGDPGVDHRVPRALCAGTQGRRGDRAEAVLGAAAREGNGAVPTVRRAGDHRAGVAAAAGAVQGVRPALRGDQGAVAQVLWGGCGRGAGCGTSAKGCWRCATGTRRSSCCTPMGRWCRWCWWCSGCSVAAPASSCAGGRPPVPLRTCNPRRCNELC